MTRKKYDQETAQNLYDGGMPFRQISALVGVPVTTLHRHLTKRNTAKPWDLGRAVAMYQNGSTLLDIAQEQNLNVKTVRSRLLRAGVHLRGRKKTESTKNKLRSYRDYKSIPLESLADSGHTTSEIAEMYGKDEESVRRAMKSRNISRLPAKARREHNYFWNGGYRVDRDGYILVHSPNHPHKTKSNCVRQHRLVMEEHLGRFLLPEEVVDHINSDKSDNRIENLRLFANNAEHLRETLKNRTKLSAEERERLRQESVQRAVQRVAAILEESKIYDPK